MAKKQIIIISVCVLLNSGIMPPPGESQVKDVTLKEIWRVEGELMGEVFGKINSIAMDDSGLVYMLDVKKSRIVVLRGTDGSYVSAFGQKGEGPGDISMGRQLFMDRTGGLGIVELIPPKIKLLTTYGEFLTETGVPLTDKSVHNALYLVDPDSEGYVISGKAGMANGNEFNYVSSIGKNGFEIIRYCEQEVAQNGTVQMHQMLFNKPKWSVDKYGKIYVSATYDKYSIDVFLRTGEKQRVIKTKYQHLPRNDAERNRLREAKRSYENSSMGARIKMSLEKFHRDIENIQTLENGRLLVLTSRGARERGPNALAIYDVWNQEGRFETSVQLLGEGRPLHDLFIFLNERLFVITDALPPYRDCFKEIDRDTPYMTVVCYDIGELLAQ